MNQTFAITRKELNSYFSSPMALIFVGVFLAATLFTFFWVDAFFARGVADVRPMFRWMPILLIFLVSTLTMRQWSEEQQTGTMEVLLTQPVHPLKLVLGKFFGVMILVVVALTLTIFLPLTVSIIGNLDWGPVWGGYIAAILLAAAYAAIGLFISSRTDNQIVALILTAIVGGLLYLLGTRGITDFAGGNLAEILRSIGAGSRFESIERGVVDLRDFVYYLSLTVLFLMFNVISLDSKRWGQGENTERYRQGLLLSAFLIGLNLIALNVWLFPLNGWRLDLTEQKAYTLAPATTDLLNNLQEPLLLRAYLSEKTHPLLAPLAPQVRDTLKEYGLASNGQVVVEVIDPLQDPEKEAEANRTYGIQPTPLQAADRYGASLVNAYFDILIRYGDQSEVLNFQDLIEVQPYPNGQADVRLRNLEYDLTRAIKKTVFGFQSIDALLASIEEPVKLTLYATPASLPENLQEGPATIEQVAGEIAANSNGKFTFTSLDVDDPNSPVNRAMLQNQFGLQPTFVSFFSDKSYYLHMVLEIGDEAQLLFPSGDLSEATIRTAIESALKRASSGFLKVVGLWTPADAPTQNAFGQPQPSLKRYGQVTEQLRQEYTVQPVTLADGQVPANVDVLVVIAPQGMSEVQRFAVDQYLMRGGSVIVSASNFVMNVDQFSGSLGVAPVEAGLADILASYGITVEPSLVMDTQNEAFPSQVVRETGIGQVVEIQALNYPPFVDIRQDGMDGESPILSTVQAVTLNWSSPLTIDEAKNEGRTVSILLQSSPASWLSSDPNAQPDPQTYPELNFPVEGQPQAYPLAVAVQGSFESFYKDQESPLAAAAQAETPPVDPATGAPLQLHDVGTIEQSPDNARLVVIGSNEFLNDIVFDLSNNLNPNRHLNSLQFIQNAVDWSVEDLDLLTIRSRGSSSRVLVPLSERQELGWEYGNYVVALLALIILGGVWRARQRSETPIPLLPRGAFAGEE